MFGRNNRKSHNAHLAIDTGMKMNTKSITAKRFSRPASTEIPSLLDGDLPRLCFRLRKRSRVIPDSKLAADETVHYIQDDASRNEIDQFASAFKTPRRNTPCCSIPASLQLPSLNDKEDERQVRTSNKETRKAKTRHFSGIRVDLHPLFESVADEETN